MSDSETASDLLMQAADFCAATLAKADDRAWIRLLTYCPLHLRAHKAATRAAERMRERAAEIADDEDGDFSWSGEDRNARIAQRVCREIAAAIRALPIEE